MHSIEARLHGSGAGASALLDIKLNTIRLHRECGEGRKRENEQELCACVRGAALVLDQNSIYKTKYIWGG